MAPTFYIENFGCRAARADGEAIASLLRISGAAETPIAEAEVVIVNTCSITAESDREARAFIRRAHRHNPEARIIATGCYAQRAPHELAALPGVAAVIGNSHKALAPEVALQFAAAAARNRSASHSNSVAGHDSSRADFQSLHRFGASAPASNQLISIPSLLAASTTSPPILADDTFAHSFLEEVPIAPGVQTRPNLKIQEGCSNRCSFCVIPQTRGNSRSLSPFSVLAHIRAFVESGGNELVLSGINLGRWGRDLDRSSSAPRTLSGLVRAIFHRTSLPRLRLSSIEPMDWDSELVGVVNEFAGKRLARHAHLPLQSGSDSVLRRMHRRYRPWHYAEKIAELLRAAGPALTLGADVMVGFPGESDREFQESYDFIRSLPFGYLHLFPFSPRPGTRAWSLYSENPVPHALVQERISALRSLAAEKSRTHRSKFVGAELLGITLHTPADVAASGRTSALTDNFIPVELAGYVPVNQLHSMRISAIAPDSTLLATPCQSDPPSGFNAATSEPALESAF